AGTAAAPAGTPAQKLVAQAAMLIGQRKLDEALPLLDQALGLEPKYVPALKLRASIRLQKNDGPRAMADFDALIRLDPKDVTLYVTRGTLSAIVRQFDSAMADFDRALAIDAKSAA